MRQKCTLRLSDGSILEGEQIGAPLTSSGELVFTTGMVGYSEALTDPSYYGQILTFTYPLIGNYGIPTLTRQPDGTVPRGFESHRVWASAAVVTIDSPETFHWNSFQSLDAWLKDQGVPGIVGVDTRHLVHLVRGAKGLFGRLEPEVPEGEKLPCGIETPCEFFDPGSQSIIGHVSSKERVLVGSGKTRIALIDCGVKWNIVRQLVADGCEVEILPWDTDFSKVDCSGWLISNGPGNPSETGDLVQRVGELLNDSRPILGICLGHQILAKAAGASTAKMPYGHRSHNQPVREEGTRRGYITSQNHGYVVEEDTLSDEWQVWFRNANDNSIEGIRHVSRPFRSIQFHPEAAGGPRDTGWILEKFVGEVRD